jgi:hypothetical protein
MKAFVRIVTVALLLAFAAGTIAHASSATFMSVKMALVDPGDMGKADCDQCGDNTASCNNLCVTPLVAMVDHDETFQPLARGKSRGIVVRGIVDRTGPPDPYPPKKLILS